MIHAGGCQCGAVRYRIEGEIGYRHLCHCRMCQKASGNYFLPLGTTPKANLTLTRGAASWFQSSDVVRRGFCSACGTPLFFEPMASQDIAVTLGSLDEPERAPPEIQSGQAARLSFTPLLASLPDEAEHLSSDWLARVALGTHQHPDHDTETWPPEDRQ